MASLAGEILSNKIVFGSNSSVTLPAGDNAARPAVPSAGDFRYNTTTNSIEFYNGSDWLGTSVNIDSQVINGDGTNQSFTLSHATTTNGILVSINGTLQQPTLAYTVSGNVITFVEIPMSTDVIEVRYIALTVTPSVNVNSVDSANVAVNTTTTIIDSFSSSQYGGARTQTIGMRGNAQVAQRYCSCPQRHTSIVRRCAGCWRPLRCWQ